MSKHRVISTVPCNSLSLVFAFTKQVIEKKPHSPSLYFCSPSRYQYSDQGTCSIYFIVVIFLASWAQLVFLRNMSIFLFWLILGSCCSSILLIILKLSMSMKKGRWLIWKHQPHKMFKLTLTISRQIAHEMFECVSRFCAVGA